MANIRLVALFALLIFLSLPPTLPSKGLEAIANGKTLSKLFKLFGKMFGAFNKVMDIYSLIQFLEEVSKSKDNAPAPNKEAEPVGFYVDFYVGYDQTRPINARMSISSSITYLENYDPPTSSIFHECCNANLSCTTNCSQYGYDYAAIDIFTFPGGGMLTNNLFRYNAGDKHKNATGFLSLSRSPNSLLNSVREQIFSYKISESESKWSLGFAANTTGLESTELVNNTNHPDLYYITLTQISIGSTLYQVDPTTKSSSVILDTVVTATVLETSLYTKVKTELMKLGSLFNDTAHGLELCISSKPNWPNLTLYFPSNSSSSGGAQMVLTRDNYVVKVEKTKTECAAIFETQGASVIGIMAQINRRMVFDLSTSEPRLYFSKYPSSAFFVVPSIIMIVISSLCVLLCLYIPV